MSWLYGRSGSMRKIKTIKFKVTLFSVITVFVVAASFIAGKYYSAGLTDNNSITTSSESVTTESIPEFTGSPYIILNDNEPEFTETEITDISYEKYSELDNLGRCGTAMACIGKDIMPTESRGSIGQIKPSGWHTVKYDTIDGMYLYNRCHLIGYQLTGENANIRNLITGTRFMNTEGMLPFENMVADYIKETDNHVMYRVTPLFDNENLVASGVQIEAYSVEDKGEGICCNVYVYNCQPGIEIDYASGDSRAVQKNDDSADDNISDSQNTDTTYIINTNTNKFHLQNCEYAQQIKSENKKEYTGKRDELINKGYDPCRNCNP